MRDWQEFFRRYCGKTAVMALFLLCALPVTMLTALLTPPGQAPDEATQYARAVGLAEGQVFARRGPAVDRLDGGATTLVGMTLEAGLVKLSVGRFTAIENRPVETQADAAALAAMPQDHFRRFCALPNTLRYFPAAYVPAAIGILAGQVLGLTPLHCFILARLCMAAAFLLLGLAALYVAAFGEAALLAVLLLPMTLFLAGTLNQDGPLLALVCFAVAALTRGTPRGRVAGLVAFALVLGAKPPYIFLLGAFTMPFFAPGFLRRCGAAALASLPVLVWGVLIALFVMVPFSFPPYLPGPLYTGPAVLTDQTSTAANLHILLVQPMRFITIPAQSLWLQGYNTWITMVGVLGTLQLVLAPGYYMAWGVCLALGGLGLLVSPRPGPMAPRQALLNFLLVAGLALASLWLLLVTQYLEWTRVGEAYVEGIEGRYLLPLLPFMLLAVPPVQALPGLRHVRWRLPPVLLALPSLMLGLFDIGYIPLKLVLNFYLH